MKVYRPAGNRVILEEQTFTPSRLTERPSRLYQSGTAALAAALLASRRLSAERDEVILPGYGCPDLLSATIHAGLKPVLVDLTKEGHGYDPEDLARQTGKRTLAIVSVRFLGLEDDLTALQQLAREQGSRLIIDSAQWFPCRTSSSDWPGDYNILSFGRGKPVNLLHGGAVICRDDHLFKALPSGDESPANQTPGYQHRLKLQAYNLAIHPVVYGLVSRLPGLHIGKTIYRPLERIERMSGYHRRLLAANIDRYRHSPIVSRRYRRLLDKLPRSGWQDMSRNISTNDLPALLRYPLLIRDERARKRFLENTSVLGVSPMYERALPEISGVAELLESRPELPNARQLAARLVTLPTHEDITEAVSETIIEQLAQALT